MKTRITQDLLGTWLASGVPCRNIVFQGCDLIAYDAAIAALPQATDPADACLFLGCKLGPAVVGTLAGNHGILFPDLPGRPYKVYRSSLYTVEELFNRYDGTTHDSYWESMDWRTYKSYFQVDAANQPSSPAKYVEVGTDEILARRLHDHFIEVETDEFLQSFKGPGKKGIVAMMGGHDTLRSDVSFRQIAHLARQLTIDGYLVASGGGPGLMEAANLGAWFGAFDDPSVLDRAIDFMASEAPKYSDAGWLSSAWKVRRDHPTPDIGKSRSFGIPTWFYGHEPPNVFASHIAKYFENSLREEGLLEIATHGVIFARGNGGTVQEIFQDCCQNYYATYGFKSPMILLDEEYWNPAADADGNYPGKTKPVWPLLRKMAQDGKFADLITLTSSPDEVLGIIRGFPDPWS